MKRPAIFFLILQSLLLFFLNPALARETIISGRIQVEDEFWTVNKKIVDGEAVSVEFIDPEGRIYDEDKFGKAARAKVEATKIEPSLKKRLTEIVPVENIPVIITLKNQPYGSILQEVREEHGARRGFVRNLEEEDSLRGQINAEASRRARTRTVPEQEFISLRVGGRGGKIIYRYSLINALSGVVPAGIIEEIADLPEVARVSEDMRMEANLNISVPAIGGNTWWNNGLTGGTFDVGILDSGMDSSHPAFSGKTIVSRTFHATAINPGATNPPIPDPDYGDDPASTDDLQGHGTHVGGIVMSQGASQCLECQGVARGLEKIFNLKAGWFNRNTGGTSMYWSDKMAAVDWAESQLDNPDVYNLSYGGDTTSDDTDGARFWDAIVSAKGNPVAISANNTGPSNTQFSDPAVAYNVLTVAAMDDRNTPLRNDDRIANFSTRGPTASGRKKPDISAPGNAIFAPRNNTIDFVGLSGTSMAAPHVAGAFLLLQDYDQSADVSSSLGQKALLINTADAWSDHGTVNTFADDGPVTGTHWDRTYGWGYINLDQAYLRRNETFSDFLTATERFRLYKGRLFSGEKATLVWHRRAIYNGINPPAVWHLLTDLDLSLRRESDNALLGSSMSAIDNVEQVAVTATEDVVLKVRLFSSTIQGATSETYGLSTGEPFSPANFNLAFPWMISPRVCPNTAFDIKGTIMNHGDIHSHNHSMSLAIAPGWNLRTLNTVSVGTLAPNKRNTEVWSVTSPSLGTGDFTITGASSSYGEAIPIPSTQFSIGVKGPSFTDVQCGHPFYGWIETMWERTITGGCAPGPRYCPDDPILRNQMAVFIIRAMGQIPSAASYNVYFDDIPDDFFAPYINRMWEIGMTVGCGSRSYCPNAPVTRGEMAAFISRAKGWVSFAPPTPTFTDVPADHPFSGFVERLWREGITSGCGPSSYCPDLFLTRGQMAVFVIRAWP
jgi:serine protease AprX